MNCVFRFGFVPGFSRAGGEDGDAVVRGHVVVGGVQIGLIAAGFVHSRLWIVGGNQHGQTAEILESTDVRSDPAGQLLAPGGLGEGVTAESHGGHENRGSVNLIGLAVANRDGRAGVIDKQLFSRVVLLPKREVLSPVPLAVQVAEPAVAVASGICLLIFLPEQFQRQILVVLQFPMDSGEIRWRVYAPAGWSRPLAEQELVEFLVAEVFLVANQRTIVAAPVGTSLLDFGRCSSERPVSNSGRRKRLQQCGTVLCFAR